MIREMLGIAEGILQNLHNDHSEVAALLERIGDSENGAQRSALFKELSVRPICASVMTGKVASR